MDSPSSIELSPVTSHSNQDTPPSSLSEYIAEHKSVQNLSQEELTQRWRPSFHLQPHTPSWMNDPCAPFYDRRTGLYHVSWQWNPDGPDWGNISWGSATSRDLIHWTIADKPTLSPDEIYDGKGIFTGCFVPSDDDSLYYAYTSVSELPIHHTLPHSIGSESLSIACSHNGGASWEKIQANPILPCEPAELEVTGWRDPFVSKWPLMAKLLDMDADTSFGIISGGIRDKTPTTFLYAIDSKDITDWEYLGPLADFGLNFHPSRWSGDYGRNWEVSNFVPLSDDLDSSIQRSFIICGTEGCVEQRHDPSTQIAKASGPGPTRPSRQQLWFCADFQRSQGQNTSSAVDAKYKFGGHLDHGLLYAANSFFDPRSDKHIAWGWIGEEDLCDELRRPQGWSGMLSMPRELRMMTMEHVLRGAKSDLASITSVEAVQDVDDSYTMRTLVSQPYAPLIEVLRRKPGVHRSQLLKQSLIPGTRDIEFDTRCVRTSQWELDAIFDVSDKAHRVGVCIAHSADWSRTTTLFLDQSSETFVVDRPSLPEENSRELINNTSEVASHTLFYTRDPDTGLEVKEQLRIRAWRDSSVLEVFVNERTAISTRLYGADETFGMRFFVDDGLNTSACVDSCELVSATLWDGIGL